MMMFLTRVRPHRRVIIAVKTFWCQARIIVERLREKYQARYVPMACRRENVYKYLFLVEGVFLFWRKQNVYNQAANYVK